MVKEKVLQSIKENNIRPKSALFFALRQIGVWFTWALTVLIGALTFSALMFRVLNSGFEHIDLITSSKVFFVLSSLPVFWILLSMASTLVAYAELRNTDRGHVISWKAAALLNVALSILTGTILFFSGFGYISERVALQIRGMDIERTYLTQWNDPGHGRLAGMISAIDDDTLSLLSIDTTGYIVDISGLEAVSIPTNTPVRIIGTFTENGDFYACRVLPVRFRGAFQRKETVFHKVHEIKTDDARTTLCRDIPTTHY